MWDSMNFSIKVIINMHNPILLCMVLSFVERSRAGNYRGGGPQVPSSESSSFNSSISYTVKEYQEDTMIYICINDASL